jgi:hypothetical protein
MRLEVHSEVPQHLALATSHRARLLQPFATCQSKPSCSSCMPYKLASLYDAICQSAQWNRRSDDAWSG